MDWEITWVDDSGGDPEDVRVTTSGLVTVEDLDAYVQEILADPRFRPGLHVLVDHRRADWSAMTEYDLRRRVDLLVRDADRIGGARSAWVGATAGDYGIGRMMQAFHESRSELSVRIFTDVDAARRWLAS
jgi:hypothetical protein